MMYMVPHIMLTPYHHPLLPVSCRRRNVIGIIAKPSRIDIKVPMDGMNEQMKFMMNTVR